MVNISGKTDSQGASYSGVYGRYMPCIVAFRHSTSHIFGLNERILFTSPPHTYPASLEWNFHSQMWLLIFESVALQIHRPLQWLQQVQKQSIYTLLLTILFFLWFVQFSLTLLAYNKVGEYCYSDACSGVFLHQWESFLVLLAPILLGIKRPDHFCLPSPPLARGS